MIALEDEKSSRLYDSDVKAGANNMPAVKEDFDSSDGETVASADGDDALRLAGTHAHQFDEGILSPSSTEDCK